MSDFDPKAYLAKKAAESDFDPKAYLAKKTGTDVGSLLEQALASQQGDLVTVQTPTGPAQFTRKGQRFYSPDEAASVNEAGAMKGKERYLEGALSFLSGGAPLMDEIRGAQAGFSGDTLGKYLADKAAGTPAQLAAPSPMEKYRQVRDSTRNDVANATRRASPTVRIMGNEVPVLPLAGAMVPGLLSPIPGTATGRILLSGAMGAGQAAGESRADLTQPSLANYDEFASDVGGGIKTGTLAAGGAEALSIPMQAIANRQASQIGNIVSERAAKDTADVAGEVASLQAKARSATQVGSRYGENTLRAANAGVMPMGQSAMGPATQGRAIGMIDSPEFKDLMESVANNTMDELPGQTGRIKAAQQAAQQAAASANGDAAKRTADFFARDTYSTDVAPRLWRQAQNAGVGTLASAPGALAAGLGMGSMGGSGAGLAGGAGMLLLGATDGFRKGALSSFRSTMANPRLQVSGLQAAIEAAQAGQQLLRKGAQVSSSATPKLAQEEEDSIQAFLTGG